MENQILKGRVAFVTGGTTGIGFGAAQWFIDQGALVYITGRRQSQLESSCSTISRPGELPMP